MLRNPLLARERCIHHCDGLASTVGVGAVDVGAGTVFLPQNWCGIHLKELERRIPRQTLVPRGISPDRCTSPQDLVQQTQREYTVGVGTASSPLALERCIPDWSVFPTGAGVVAQLLALERCTPASELVVHTLWAVAQSDGAAMYSITGAGAAGTAGHGAVYLLLALVRQTLSTAGAGATALTAGPRCRRWLGVADRWHWSELHRDQS